MRYGRFVIRTAWTNAVPKTYELTLDDLAEPGQLDILRSVFFDPEKLRPKETRAAITKEAADKFSTISFRLQGRDTPENLAHFVNQLVFCFFAHSVKLLPNGLFPKLLKRCAERPENAKRYFDGLFAAMEKGGDYDLTEIAHFNGGLFDGRRAMTLQSDEIGLLQAAASLDWSQIDPTIFGTLFERFLDPRQAGTDRRALYRSGQDHDDYRAGDPASASGGMGGGESGNRKIGGSGASQARQGFHQCNGKGRGSTVQIHRTALQGDDT